MSIFENISKKVTQTAKYAAKKSGDMVEVTKLSISIGAEEDKIRKVFTDIGRIVYAVYSRGDEVSDDIKDLCEKAKSYENNIEEMKQKILELRNVKLCPGCGLELDMDMAYCYKCGAKQAMPRPEPEDRPEKEPPGES